MYTDNTLCISVNPEEVLKNEIGKYFELKKESIGPPKIYLGGTISKVTLENQKEACVFSLSKYINKAVKNVEKYCGKRY